MLSQIADIADLIAAAAIIVSLLFVAYEVRLNRKQAELANWRETLAAPGGALWWADAHLQGRFMRETYRVIDALLAKPATNGGKPVLKKDDL